MGDRFRKTYQRAALSLLPKEERALLLKHDPCLEACGWIFQDTRVTTRPTLAWHYERCERLDWLKWIVARIAPKRFARENHGGLDTALTFREVFTVAWFRRQVTYKARELARKATKKA